ncbi:MAG: hypothetical protein JWN70_6928 [Planctomycetaceae bacterium]|nr:hypothetical protein [Planctomycetaceae bacterium]
MYVRPEENSAWERRGLTVFDVHGDLAEAVTNLAPRQRTNDVIVFDAASDNVVPFNPLACYDPARVDQVTSGVVSAFRKRFDSSGPLRLIAWYGVDTALAASFATVTIDAGTSCAMALKSRSRAIISDFTAGEYLFSPAGVAHRAAGILAAQTTPLVTRSGELLGMMSTHWARP